MLKFWGRHVHILSLIQFNVILQQIFNLLTIYIYKQGFKEEISQEISLELYSLKIA